MLLSVNVWEKQVAARRALFANGLLERSRSRERTLHFARQLPQVPHAAVNSQESHS